MIYPKFLNKNDLIGVPAPSGGAYDDFHKIRFKNSKNKIEQMGYKVKLSKNIYKSYLARSAGEVERAEEINNMFVDKEVDFLICASGGEFLVEILPYINFTQIAKNPKFIEGFSDATGLLFPITTKYDISTIYGMNFGKYGTETYDRNILENLEILNGNIVNQENYDMYEKESADYITGLEGYNYTDKVEWKYLDRKEVNLRGRIIGGNLDVISYLAGTKYDGTNGFIEKYKEDGIIWYFENCDLSLEDVIRTLWKLDELGYFRHTKGIIFGRNGNDKTLLGYTMEQALKDSIIYKKNIPIIYDVDISHRGPSFTIINGAIATITSKDGKGDINFELK